MKRTAEMADLYFSVFPPGGVAGVGYSRIWPLRGLVAR